MVIRPKLARSTFRRESVSGSIFVIWAIHFAKFRRQFSLDAKLLSPAGVETLFTSLEAAYEGLSKVMKQRVEGFNCFHRVTTTQNTKRRHASEEAAAMERSPAVVHPSVGIDPNNRRKCLFVNVRSIAVASQGYLISRVIASVRIYTGMSRGPSSISVSFGKRILL